MKHPWKLALIGGAALFTLWIAGLTAVWLLFPPEKIKAIVLERGTAMLHRPLVLGSAHLRLLPFLGVSLEEITLANNPDSGFSKEPLVTLKSLDVKLSIWSLFKLSPVVREVTLREPRFRLEILADGRSSLDGLGGPKATAKPSDTVKALELPFPLTVQRLAIANGSVKYLDRQNQREITIGDIDQSASFATDKSLQNAHSDGEMALSEISITGAGLPVRKNGLRLHINHDLNLNLPAASIEVREIKLRLQDVAVKLSGRASNLLVTPDIDLQFGTDGVLDLHKLLAEIPPDLNPALSKLALAGSLEAAFHAQGKLAPHSIPKLDGSLHLRDLSASVVGVPTKLSKLKSAIHLRASQNLVIDSTSWLLGNAPGSLELTIDSLPTGSSSHKPLLRHLLAEGKIDLAAFAKIFGPVVPDLDSLQPTGTLGWKLAGHGRLDPANPAGLEIQGDITFDKVSAKLKGIADRPVVTGTASIANASLGAKLGLQVGATDLALNAKATDWLALVLPKLAEGKIINIVVDARSKFIDVDKFLPPPDPSPKAPSALPSELPLLPPATVVATFEAEQILALGLKIRTVAIKTKLTGGQFTENLVGSVAEGGIVQSLQADLRNPKLLDVALTANLNGVQIHDVLVALKERIPEGTPRMLHDKLYGKGNAKVVASVKAPPREASNKLSADITGSFVDGKITNFPALAGMTTKAHVVFPQIPESKEFNFNTLSLKARLEAGRLLVQDLAMDGSALGMVQATGSIGTDQSLDLKIDTHLPQSASSGLQSGASSALAATGLMASTLGINAGSPLPTDDKKRIILSWIVKGSFASPSISYDTPRLSTLAKGAASLLAAEAKTRAEALLKEQGARVKKEAADAVKQQLDQNKSKVLDGLKDQLKKLW